MLSLVKYKSLATIFVACCVMQSAFSEEAFNVAFLNGKQDPAAFEAVQQGYAILPGEYSFSVFINKEKIDDRNIIFYKNKKNEVGPCLDNDFIKDYGIIVNTSILFKNNNCINLSDVVKDSNVTFDVDTHRLDLSIPQVNLDSKPKGYIPPKLYDEGISALLLDYNVSGNYTSLKNGSDYGSITGIFNSGFNLGAWRYRNQSSYMGQTHYNDKWESVSNKLERDILAWKSRLEIGDSYTNNDLFDSYNFKGVQLSSDTSQLPYSLQSYAPIVRGVAATNARIEIRQNGYLIYSNNVAPGAFEITDLVSASDSGDLHVKVVESDGTVKSFIQPYSAVPKMLREGIWRYQLTAGKYRTGDNTKYKPSFMQMTLARGISNYYTPYVGVLISDDYFAVGAGLGLSLGSFGAISFDTITSHNKLASGGSADGNSFRFLYSKSLNQFGTNLRVIGYRYSTSNYYDFADSIAEKEQWKNGYYQSSYYLPNNYNGVAEPALDKINTKRYSYSKTYQNKKNQLQISLNQSLGNYGQIYANVSSQNYWNGGDKQRSFQLGYNTNYKKAMLGFYYQYNKSQFLSSDYTVGMSVTIPFGTTRNLISSSSYEYNKSNGYTAQTGISGSFLENKNLQINAQAGVSKFNDNTEQFNIAYQGSKNYASAGYSTGNNYQSYSANISGGVLVHSGGITLGQSLLNNPILVEAKGAEGTRVENQTGVEIDNNGYAIISSSSPYRKNRVSLKATDLNNDINIDNTIIDNIVPTKKAIVKVKYNVSKGINILASLRTSDNKPIILGASVYNADNAKVGMVGSDGSAYVSGINPPEILVVKWGNDLNHQCHFSVPATIEESIGYTEISVQCLKN